jgi:hypothetical protein
MGLVSLTNSYATQMERSALLLSSTKGKLRRENYHPPANIFVTPNPDGRNADRARGSRLRRSGQNKLVSHSEAHKLAWNTVQGNPEI